MEIKFDEKDKLCRVIITEEMDHHTTQKMRKRIDAQIGRFIPQKVVIDLEKVSFMDSAGIGLILGRYQFISLLRWNYGNSKCL